ncbi:MAG TPA: hypothetical protein PKC21_04790 [Oligoflexia bacterium]|nr:hypothetical protein [Oligoflexia bacterium]HMR24654.1 hypothetical protein [Oligoflexia bacterium]
MRKKINTSGISCLVKIKNRLMLCTVLFFGLSLGWAQNQLTHEKIVENIEGFQHHYEREMGYHDQREKAEFDEFLKQTLRLLRKTKTEFSFQTDWNEINQNFSSVSSYQKHVAPGFFNPSKSLLEINYPKLDVLLNERFRGAKLQYDPRVFNNLRGQFYLLTRLYYDNKFSDRNYEGDLAVQKSLSHKALLFQPQDVLKLTVDQNTNFVFQVDIEFKNILKQLVLRETLAHLASTAIIQFQPDNSGLARSYYPEKSEFMNPQTQYFKRVGQIIEMYTEVLFFDLLGAQFSHDRKYIEEYDMIFSPEGNTIREFNHEPLVFQGPTDFYQRLFAHTTLSGDNLESIAIEKLYEMIEVLGDDFKRNSEVRTWLFIEMNNLGLLLEDGNSQLRNGYMPQVINAQTNKEAWSRFVQSMERCMRCTWLSDYVAAVDEYIQRGQLDKTLSESEYEIRRLSSVGPLFSYDVVVPYLINHAFVDLALPLEFETKLLNQNTREEELRQLQLKQRSNYAQKIISGTVKITDAPVEQMFLGLASRHIAEAMIDRATLAPNRSDLYFEFDSNSANINLIKENIEEASAVALYILFNGERPSSIEDTNAQFDQLSKTYGNTFKDAKSYLFNLASEDRVMYIYVDYILKQIKSRL